ncbi:MAG: TniB family NTP-binding protein [Paraglaciecola sp.]|uniref:TniB family NTP-binding protein n=1 Tax=Alishewanella sp. HL-SH05 TaxID=3461145 RepID=UPI00275908C1|nr:TniB family NTP-binding protein [Paraglaciecola sp.]
MINETNYRVSKFVNERVISPELQIIISALDHCRTFSKLGGEPQCMLITGPSGVGKTSIIEKYLKDHQRRHLYEATEIPVLNVTLSEIKTTVSMYQQILHDLGHPRPFDSNSELELRVQIKKLVVNCKVEMIIIDEFQQLIEKKTQAILSDTANSLKRLILDIKIPVILVGMPYSSVILDTNSQLSSRFELRHCIHPFRMSTTKERTAYISFLNLLEKQMSLPEQSHLNTDDIAKRLYFYCKGSFRPLKNLLNIAFYQALMNDETKITLTRLAATAAYINPKLDKRTNPFLIDAANIIIVEPNEKAGWEDYHEGKARFKKSKKSHDREILSNIFN